MSNRDIQQAERVLLLFLTADLLGLYDQDDTILVQQDLHKLEQYLLPEMHTKLQTLQERVQRCQQRCQENPSSNSRARDVKNAKKEVEIQEERIKMADLAKMLCEQLQADVKTALRSRHPTLYWTQEKLQATAEKLNIIIAVVLGSEAAAQGWAFDGR